MSELREPESGLELLHQHPRPMQCGGWVLDVTFDEIRTRTRRDDEPDHPAIVRKLALDVLRSTKPVSVIRRKRRRSGWSDVFAREIVDQVR